MKNGKRRDEIDSWTRTVRTVIQGALGTVMLARTILYGLPPGLESDAAILGWYGLLVALMGPVVSASAAEIVRAFRGGGGENG